MPGPRNKAKSKPRNHVSNGSTGNLSLISQSSSTPEAIASEIDDVNGWTEIVKFLCEYFRLPGMLQSSRVMHMLSVSLDLNRRSGLKKIHANFSEVYRRLNKAYTSHAGKEKIMGGIVAIWAKMCVDAVLRNRLVDEGT